MVPDNICEARAKVSSIYLHLLHAKSKDEDALQAVAEIYSQLDDECREEVFGS